MQQSIFVSTSSADTERAGRAIGMEIVQPLTIALTGPLGAGKTTLVRGIAAGLDVLDPHVITSPTFVLSQFYEGRWTICHIDAYRLHSANELLELGFHEFFALDVVVVVEWADRVASVLPPNHLAIAMDHVGEEARRLTFQARGPNAAKLLDAVGCRLAADPSGLN